MFFKTLRITQQEENKQIIEAMFSQKEEINARLAEMSRITEQLQTVVSETHQIALQVTKKIKSELKVAKKSVLSIIKRLQAGAILLDWQGHIIQINNSAELMFGIKESSCLNNHFYELMEFSDKSLIPNKPNFFSELSEKILLKSNDGLILSCSTGAKVKSELPSCFDIEKDVATSVQLASGKSPIKLNLTFSILDNNPEQVNDVVYVFLFKELKASTRQLTKRSTSRQYDGPERRLI